MLIPNPFRGLSSYLICTYLICVGFKGHGQCTETPANPNLNLKQTIFTGLNAINGTRTVKYTKGPVPGNYTDVTYSDDEYTSVSGSCPPQSFSCLPADRDILKYTVYYPKDHDFTSASGCALPAIILFHAGGFMECSSRDQPTITTICNEFARRGFVAFNVEYRDGRVTDYIDKSSDNPVGYTTVQQQLAAYRACQDGRGAIRSIIKRQMNETSGDNFLDPYRIDLNQIFVGGMSAGGLIAMNAAWYTSSMIDAAFPQKIGTPSIQTVLGSIDADYYYGGDGSSINIQTYIKGVINMWGGISIPKNYDNHEYDFFSLGTSLAPVIAFHGRLDGVFPYYDDTKMQRFKFSPSTEFGGYFNAEGFAQNPNHRCLLDNSNTYTYTLDDVANTSDLVQGSSLNIYKILTHYDKMAELYLDCDMHHGLDCEPYDGVNCKTQYFKSDFGTCLITADLVAKYMVQRAATFFQAIMNLKNRGDFNKTVFVECENKRNKCITTIDDYDCNHHLDATNNCVNTAYTTPCDSGVN